MQKPLLVLPVDHLPNPAGVGAGRGRRRRRRVGDGPFAGRHDDGVIAGLAAAHEQPLARDPGPSHGRDRS